MKASDFFDTKTQALLIATEKGDAEKAREIMGTGASFNIHGKEGITPLLYLLIKQKKAAMQLALTLGADPNFADTDGEIPVTMASGAKDDELLYILLEGGGNPNALNSNGYPALFNAIGEERLGQIDMLLKFGADMNLVNGAKDNSANYASTLNKYEIVYSLIEKGVDFTNRNSVDVDVAWELYHSLSNNLLATEYPSYTWALKVKQQLIDRGVAFPPLSPLEVRHLEGRLDSVDLELLRERELDGSLDDIDRKILQELKL